jgi:hypothetical protein
VDREGEEDDHGLVMALPTLPGTSGRDVDPGTTRREEKARLREANATLARALVHRTGWPHAKVNAELNRMAGIRRITEATAEQLARRKLLAERWYART